MHMRIRTWSLSIATLVGLSGTAFAADMPVKARPVAEPIYQHNWYIEGTIAIPLRRDYDFTSTGLPSGTYKPDIGLAGQIAVGKHFAPNWRAEVYFFYGRGSDGSVTFAGVPFPQSGDAIGAVGRRERLLHLQLGLLGQAVCRRRRRRRALRREPDRLPRRCVRDRRQRHRLYRHACTPVWIFR